MQSVCGTNICVHRSGDFFSHRPPPSDTALRSSGTSGCMPANPQLPLHPEKEESQTSDKSRHSQLINLPAISLHLHSAFLCWASRSRPLACSIASPLPCIHVNPPFFFWNKVGHPCGCPFYFSLSSFSFASNANFTRSLPSL